MLPTLKQSNVFKLPNNTFRTSLPETSNETQETQLKSNKLLVGFFVVMLAFMFACILAYTTDNIIATVLFHTMKNQDQQLTNSLLIHLNTITVVLGYSIASCCFQWCTDTFYALFHHQQSHLSTEESTDSLMELQIKATNTHLDNNTVPTINSLSTSTQRDPYGCTRCIPSYMTHLFKSHPTCSRKIQRVIENSVLLTLMWTECTVGIIYIKDGVFLERLSIGIGVLVVCGLVGRLVQ